MPAIEAWTSALGEAKVACDAATLDRYGRTTQPVQHRPCCVLYPTSTEEIQEIVRIAAVHGIKLYPISRGRNWGYSDASPTTDGAAIIDLSRMNRIVEVNTELAYAVIEPGVSQGELSAYLSENKTGLVMDCTGAGPHASIIGNTLERGFGHSHHGDHLVNTCGVEIVLADGRVLKTGFGHYGADPVSYCYRYGAGPFLDGLFTQSNFGIVTKAGVWLMHEPEDFCFFAAAVDNEKDLPEFIDRLRPLRQKGLLSTAIHIGNDLRVLSARTAYPWDATKCETPLPDNVRAAMRRKAGIGLWNAGGALMGTPDQVRSGRRALRKVFRGFVRYKFVNDRQLAMADRFLPVLNSLGFGRQTSEQIAALRPTYNLLKGIPEATPLHAAHWRLRNPPAEIPADSLDPACGLIWMSPVLPMRGDDARKVMTLTDAAFAKHGFEPLVTFTMVNERALIGIIQISYDKTVPGEGDSAAACYRELFDALMAAGYPPYRVGLSAMDKLQQAGDTFWDVASAIKRALDPSDMLAPGRYVPPLG